MGELTPITRKEKIIAGENIEPITREEAFLKEYGGGGGGTSDYEALENKPSINGNTLEGALTTEDLDISYNDLQDKPDIPSGGATIEKIPFTYEYPYFTLDKSIYDYDIVAVFMGSNSTYAADSIHYNTYLGNYYFVSIGNLVEAAGTVIKGYQKFASNEDADFTFTVGGSDENLGKILQYTDTNHLRTEMIHFIGIKL